MSELDSLHYSGGELLGQQAAQMDSTCSLLMMPLEQILQDTDKADSMFKRREVQL